ncbi:MAG: MBL fold metallo-hydrolase [Gemmatimonadales bacterium]|nr:MBL fold metallo-hydrolase [Gemmatimonadales bacterium]
MFESPAGLTRRQVVAFGAGLAATRLFAGCGTRPARRAVAPRLGASQPTHYRFELGEFEVTTISDAGAMLDGPWPIVGEDRSQAEVEQLMREHLLPEKKFQPGFTPTLVNTGKELILFDTGNGASGFVPRPYGGWLAAQLGPAGFAPEQIDVVVLTHGHPDHIGGLMENGKPLFPKARYVMGDVEYDFWSSKDHLSAPPEGNEYKTGKLFQANVAPLASRISFLKPDGEVAPGIRAIEAYGHTPGHLAFHLESQGKRLFFWGDCAHHEVASLARPEWHVFFDMDKEKGAATRKRMYAMAAAERLPVVGYHMSFPSIGFVEKQDRGYRWLPVTYQLNL